MENEKKQRRSFLKHILAGSAALAGAAAARKPARAEKPLSAARPDEILYHESEAFRKYYQSLRS